MKPNSVRLWMTILTLFASCGLLAAQDEPLADLKLEAVLVPADAVTPPGSSGTLTLTVTNLGPDPRAGYNEHVYFLSVFGNSHVIGEHGSPIHFHQIGGDPNCFLHSGIPSPEHGMPYEIIYSLEIVGGLFLAESSTCELEFTVNPYADQDILTSWFAFSFAEDDPDDSNNLFVTHLHLVAPSEIPTLSPAGLIGACILIGAAGLAMARRRTKQPTRS